MDKIKLGDLVAARQRMTKCEYKAEDSWNNAGCHLADFSIPGSCTGKTIEMLADDAHGIVATLNAADVLIEITSAALVIENSGPVTPAEYRTMMDRLSAALAKVEP